MRDKLLELRDYYQKELEKAERHFGIAEKQNLKGILVVAGERMIAFSEFIEKLDLILNNSVVKPTDSRSPEGQGEQSVVSRPNDSQNQKHKYEVCDKCGGNCYTLTEALEGRHFDCHGK